MRWAEWILRQGSPSTQSARRKARLAIQPLEDRTVPHAAGAEHVDHPTDPAPDVAVVKEVTPPAPTDETIIHLDNPVIEPGDGQVKVEEKAPTDEHVADDSAVPPSEVVQTFGGAAAENSPQAPTPAPKPNPPLPQIGDKVWLDQNANGLQDSGEPGLGFVNLQLYQGNTLVGTTMSDGLGYYAFNVWNVNNGTTSLSDDGLKANTAYQIRIAADQPALNGLRPTSTNVGSTNAEEQRDSDATYAATGATLDFTMGTDEIYTHYDIGYVSAASVGNLVWNDENNNGRRDKNEAGIAGVTVRLLDTGGTQVATTTSAPDGSYQFKGLLPGTYVVEVAASNFASGGKLVGASSSTGKVGQLGGPVEGAGTPDPDANSMDNDDNGSAVNGAVQCKPVTLMGATDNNTVDFGFFHPVNLNGRVFVDMNGNGRVDPEDTAGVAKVRIRLAGPTGTYTTLTDANGNYSFANLPMAIYTVTENQPVGYRSSTANMVTTPLTSGTTSINFGEARAAELRVGIQASQDTIGVGGTLTLTYRVKNLGTLDATGVVLSTPLPSAYKYLSSDSIKEVVYDPATQRATIGTLAAGAEVEVKVKVQPTRPGAFRFRATVQSQDLEENLLNNTAAIVVTSTGAPLAPMTRWLFSRM